MLHVRDMPGIVFQRNPSAVKYLAHVLDAIVTDGLSTDQEK